MSGQGRLYSVEDWCRVKVGYILWRTGVGSRWVIFCGGLVSGQGRLYSVEDWCRVKVGYILWRTGVGSR